LFLFSFLSVLLVYFIVLTRNKVDGMGVFINFA
jgi:hypothetical protein